MELNGSTIVVREEDVGAAAEAAEVVILKERRKDIDKE